MLNATVISLFMLLANEPAPALDAVADLSVGDPEVAESVVYAQVVSVEPDKRYEWRLHVTLNVASTLAGAYDAAAWPVLRTAMDLLGGQLGRFVGPDFKPPKPKAWIVVRLHANAEPGPVPWFVAYDEGRRGNPSGGPAFVEVKGFDDPKVAEIIARLRKRRAEKPLDPWEAARQSIIAEWANREAAWARKARPAPDATKADRKTPAGGKAVPAPDAKDPRTMLVAPVGEHFIPPQAVLDFLDATRKPAKIDAEQFRQLLDQMNKRATELQPKRGGPKRD